ncbi:MAG: DUF4244 domain-containing protein [Streptosporangiales bacterium]|nr:DUF4244 domain-containing protein [Streptosporangiales bacterium]
MLPVPRPARALPTRRRRARGDSGMTTAEYAVGTVAAVGLAGILYKLLTSPEVQELIWTIIQKAVEAFV